MQPLMKILLQSLCIITLSTVLALGSNALRPHGLPLLHAEESAVDLDNGGETISVKDAAMLFLSGRAVFLDARSRFEYEDGHIQGALPVPAEEFDFIAGELTPKLQGKEVLITYCDGERCPLSHELAASLHTAGFDNVRVLVNGWTLWNRENLPVTAKGQ